MDSFTSHAIAMSVDFDPDFQACCETLFQMADRVVRLCTDCKETQTEKQVPCEQGENRNSTSSVSPVSPLPPTTRTSLESFSTGNMAEQIAKAFFEAPNRDQLSKKILEITEKMALEHKKDVETAQAYLVEKHADEIFALEVELAALVEELKKAEANGARQ